MRKDTTTAKITEIEIDRNKKISKKRYVVEQYFGLSHLYDGLFSCQVYDDHEEHLGRHVPADGV